MREGKGIAHRGIQEYPEQEPLNPQALYAKVLLCFSEDEHADLPALGVADKSQLRTYIVDRFEQVKDDDPTVIAHMFSDALMQLTDMPERRREVVITQDEYTTAIQRYGLTVISEAVYSLAVVKKHMRRHAINNMITQFALRLDELEFVEEVSKPKLIDTLVREGYNIAEYCRLSLRDILKTLGK